MLNHNYSKFQYYPINEKTGGGTKYINADGTNAKAWDKDVPVESQPYSLYAK